MKEKNKKGWGRHLEEIEEGLVRLWKQEDEHTCADISFPRMMYTVRTQVGFARQPDAWTEEEHQLARVGPGHWEYSLDSAQIERREADLRRSLQSLDSFPNQDGFTKSQARDTEHALHELLGCNGWCELDDQSSELIEEAFIAFNKKDPA